VLIVNVYKTEMLSIVNCCLKQLKERCDDIALAVWQKNRDGEIFFCFYFKRFLVGLL